MSESVRDVAEHEDIELTSETLDFIEMHPGAGDATYAPLCGDRSSRSTGQNRRRVTAAASDAHPRALGRDQTFRASRRCSSVREALAFVKEDFWMFTPPRRAALPIFTDDNSKSHAGATIAVLVRDRHAGVR